MLLENNQPFQSIQTQFLCCVPVKEIEWMNALDNLSWDDQEYLINQTVNLPTLKRYPLQIKYVIRFLRHIIDVLESQNDEIHDQLFTTLCDYQAKDDTSDSYSFKHYRVRQQNEEAGNPHVETIVLKENHNKISQGTTGLNVWEAAFALSEWAIQNKSNLCGKHILELGAGTGFSSLVIGKYCEPKSVTITDGNDKVIAYLRENVNNNFDCDEAGLFYKNNTVLDVVKIDWNLALDDEATIFKTLNPPDLIIAADVVYDNTLFHPLCQTLDGLFQRNEKCMKFLLVNAVRNEETEKEFLQILKKYKFDYVKEQIVPPRNFYWKPNDHSPIQLYFIERSNSTI